MSTATVVLFVVAALVVTQRGAELALNRRNVERLRRQGAHEVGRAHYPLFFLLHGGWLSAWLVEAMVVGPELVVGWPAWLGLAILAQGMRYWAISTLGGRWTTRILVVPGEAPIRSGPYRWLSHPNYLAVVAELLALPMMFGAAITATVFSVANLVLLLAVRIPCESRALQVAATADSDSTASRGRPAHRPQRG